METVGILDDIEALVFDKLEVVSYKWLSRNFSVSSNVSKRLLQEFVNKHSTGLRVVYALCGWVKSNPQCYHVKLVSDSNLQEAKQEFDGNCSVHVYSVQVEIPNDPAALWNGEFIQAEELFRQSLAIQNCLRDNRFGGIFNPFVQRKTDGSPVGDAPSQPKNMGTTGPSNRKPAHETIRVGQNIKGEKSDVKVPQPTNLVKDVTAGSHGTGVSNQVSKPPADKEEAPLVPVNGKKDQNNKSSTGNGGSLASLWGRASTKSKLSSASAEDSNPTASTDAKSGDVKATEDQISDDEAEGVNFKRHSNGDGSRKRRVVLDFSDDECEDVVSLESPNHPKGKVDKSSSNEKSHVDKHTEDKPLVKEEKSNDRASNQALGKSCSISDQSISLKNLPKGTVKADTAAKAAPVSDKRRKVLKTRIDDRGREVNEVVWEGEETETKKAESNALKEADSKSAKNAESDTTKEAESNPVKRAENTAATNNRAAATKKSPAIGNTGGKGNKKGANKDPKQGNILSFFKKV